MGTKDNYHVTPHPQGWAVKREHAERASSVHGTKEEAVRAGIDLAKRHEGSLRIHNQDGRIQEERTYREDPYPPEG
ncbi:MAG TPA: DUF2188 domain-containing protein [Candidatus Thermoplasmatota archaeon]|nr:DUF2188 domain-containing protein [Candidatus Thermoplasmatota archaeon]